MTSKATRRALWPAGLGAAALGERLGHAIIFTNRVQEAATGSQAAALEAVTDSRATALVVATGSLRVNPDSSANVACCNKVGINDMHSFNAYGETM